MKLTELLARGVLVDLEDQHLLETLHWYIGNDGYVQRKPWSTGKVEYLHHRILARELGKVTDHINQNKLDNRKINLRNISHRENCCNTKSYRNGKGNPFRYTAKHIRQNKNNGKFVVDVAINGGHNYLGVFTDIHEACQARDTFLQNETINT